MSNKPTHKPPAETPAFVERIIDDLNKRNPTQQPLADEVAPPRGPLHPPQPAELDQDSGGGHNADGEYPQT